MRRAFTIVELLMVVAIVGILLGLSGTAVTAAVRRMRDQQASACVTLVNQGVSAYYAQHGQWPGPIGTKVSGGSRIETSNSEESYALTPNEVRLTVKAIVDEARQGRAVMDISGLYVSRKSDQTSPNTPGLDFLSAIHGTKKSGKKMSSSEMWFGYPSDRGFFRSFHAYYYPKTDQLVFTK